MQCVSLQWFSKHLGVLLLGAYTSKFLFIRLKSIFNQKTQISLSPYSYTYKPIWVKLLNR